METGQEASCLYFICMCSSLILDSPMLLSVGENHINITEGEVVRLGDILEFFNKGGRVSNAGPQSLFYLRVCLMKSGHVP